MNAPKRTWQLAESVAPSDELLRFLGDDTFLAQLLTRRCVLSPEAAREFLYPEMYPVTPPEELPDLSIARDRLLKAIMNSEKIGVWGDFDVDGQTSTTLLVGVLNALGAETAFHIPVRYEENHGIKIPFLEKFLKEEKIDLLLTCDTGITAHEAVNFANQQGVEVIITDHHELPETLPAALACVNPRRTPPGHPLHELTGAGCAYKLVESICDTLGKPEIAEAQLDLTALGTVADVGKLKDENRYIVQRGIEIIRQNQRVGLKALLAAARVTAGTFNEEKISFAIAPRMNSLGRLADAAPIVEMMTTDSEARASQMAIVLDGLNAQRKEKQNRIREEAFRMVENNPIWLENHALVLHNEDWEGGIVGIVANALVERYGKPTFLLCGNRDGVCSGSARSVDGISIIEAIRALKPPLISGEGHPMAAGVSLKIEDIEAFRHGMHTELSKRYPEGLPPLTLDLEMELPFNKITMKFVENLESLAPFGAGNPRPIFFTRNVNVRSAILLGREEKHRKVILADEEEHLLEVIWWNSAEENLPEGKFDIAYTLQSSSFSGKVTVQALWKGSQQTTEQKPVHTEYVPLRVIDKRKQIIPAMQFIQWESDPDTLIWLEGSSIDPFNGVNRLNLRPVKTLVLYSRPPSQAILRSLLESTQAETLVIIGKSKEELDAPQVFLNLLIGMTKFSLNKQNGVIPVSRLAAASCHKDATIRKGIEYLAALGKLRLVGETEEALQISSEDCIENDPLRRKIQKELNYLMRETSAFRHFFMNTKTDWFVDLHQEIFEKE